VANGPATFVDSASGPDSGSAYEVFTATIQGSSSVRAALSQSIVIPVGTSVTCSWAYKVLNGNADYVEASFYVDGQLCIDTDDTPGGFSHYSGTVTTRANPSTITIWLGTDTAGGNIVAAFDSVSLMQAGLSVCTV
jgi:hypothetical protein